MGDLIIRPKMPALCGGCQFAETVGEQLTLIECHGLPPTPILLGMDARQNPVMQLTYARLPRSTKACALHREKVPDFSEQN